MAETQKVILIGDGAVGSSFAYANVLSGVGQELGIIDLAEDRVQGDVLDLIDALAYTSPKHIYKAEYADCRDADVVVITAGAAQKPGETRLDLVNKNLRIFKAMIKDVVDSGFDGIFLVATNPVDILTYATKVFSGFPSNRVIGSGTTLDSARFRQEIAEIINVDTRNVHAYIMGEHGDSEFAAWSRANVGGLQIYDWVQEHENIDEEELLQRFYKVRDKAYEIIKLKGATHYGVAVALNRILKAIFHNENAILPVSSYLDGEYGIEDVYLGTPSVINNRGVRTTLELELSDHELEQFRNSADQVKAILHKAMDELD
ncbi:L-lactate dehydrogenase [Aerococcus kribbianus]|uniref:L-lactate dehydrogenase n=1 Tax=Aerococcus kribbianus TaxID=2999064 RepID=A0A9X3FXL4_9LACT|nr:MULTISPECIES: L-lactate dehydrogenase [unclassified Aerococcus]MCZ0718034.1 L-lactate dehydrogenase [Aerococcus sp. YH-aer221]MCZ0726397.1 L-lactate dehydrogenase [Aerococcus sp. YH-aer222]